MQSEDLDPSRICSLIETEDKRIASGGEDGNISISSYDIEGKTWNIDICRDKAHKECVKSLCTLTGNRLLSGSDDDSIKVWSLSEEDLTQIKLIKKHNNAVCKIIPLSNERFASYSDDCSVRIWKGDNTYKRLSTLKHPDGVCSILRLKGKEILVSSSIDSVYF